MNTFSRYGFGRKLGEKMTTQRAPIIANYFKIGRKIPMTIPFIGHMLISGLLMLNVYAKDWPVEATISEVKL